MADAPPDENEHAQGELSDDERAALVVAISWEAWRAKFSGLAQYYLFMALRVVSLGGSATVPVLAFFQAEYLVTTWVAAAVFLAEVFIRVVDPGAHALNHIKKADDLRAILWRYKTGFDAPFNGDKASAFSGLARMVHEVRNRNLISEFVVLTRTFAPDTERQ